MNNQNWDTAYLWTLIHVLLGVIVCLACCLILYLPLRSTIHDYLNKPKYTEAQLEAFAKRSAAARDNDWDRVEKGIHVKTGMVYDKNFPLIKSSCLSCHSSKLIIQNRADRNGWKQMIRWMQDTQGLPDLGEKEAGILDYLSKHYAPTKTGRRPNLDTSQLRWYVLDLVEN